ncbi:MAG: type I phosphomannose isomerase catalytic subunit [Culicoidibacterales bacterium]
MTKMEKEILFLAPAFQERIWGGNQLFEWFPQLDKLLPHKKVGECWAISAHPHGISKIINGSFSDMGLDEVYLKHPELFGNTGKTVFPLLVKILDASADLSVQVHPNDKYGLAVEGELGKTECWYVLDCQQNATIIYGHTAPTKEVFFERIENNQWVELLTEIPVKKGDFFYVPSGTIHAIKAGTLILEVQQSSDTTYRLYDYDRLDDNGNKRPLHLQKSIDVTTIPHQEIVCSTITEMLNGAVVTTLIASEFFTVEKVVVVKAATYVRKPNYVLATVAQGRGTINGVACSKGASFIIPTTVDSIEIVGELELIMAFE